MLFKLSSLTLGYFNPALNNSAQVLNLLSVVLRYDILFSSFTLS